MAAIGGGAAGGGGEVVSVPSRPKRASLEGIPPEIFGEVFKYLGDADSVPALRLTSKTISSSLAHAASMSKDGAGAEFKQLSLLADHLERQGNDEDALAVRTFAQRENAYPKDEKDLVDRSRIRLEEMVRGFALLSDENRDLFLDELHELGFHSLFLDLQMFYTEDEHTQMQRMSAVRLLFGAHIENEDQESIDRLAAELPEEIRSYILYLQSHRALKKGDVEKCIEICSRIEFPLLLAGFYRDISDHFGRSGIPKEIMLKFRKSILEKEFRFQPVLWGDHFMLELIISDCLGNKKFSLPARLLQTMYAQDVEHFEVPAPTFEEVVALSPDQLRELQKRRTAVAKSEIERQRVDFGRFYLRKLSSAREHNLITLLEYQKAMSYLFRHFYKEIMADSYNTDFFFWCMDNEIPNLPIELIERIPMGRERRNLEEVLIRTIMQYDGTREGVSGVVSYFNPDACLPVGFDERLLRARYNEDTVRLICEYTRVEVESDIFDEEY